MNNYFPSLSRFLFSNNHLVQEQELSLQIASHPNFPSLYAIADTFTKLGIENGAFRVNREDYDQLPQSFIAVLEATGQNKNIVFVEKKSKNVKVNYENGKNVTLTIKDFLLQWNGVFLAVEPNEKHHIKFTLNKSLVFASLVGLIGLLTFIISLDLVLVLTFLLLIIGNGISVLITQKSLGIHNHSTAKICGTGNNISCDAVISFKGAKFLGFLELSDASSIYFFSLTLSMLILGLTINAYALFYLFASMGVLILPYTIYYQWRIIKQWCTLCLGVSLVVALLFVCGMVFLFNTDFLFAFNYREFGVLIFSLLFVSFLWLEIKDIWKENTSLKRIEFNYIKIKKNPIHFKAALEQSKSLTKPMYSPIIMGNEEAEDKITVVLSPLCIHCRNYYKNIQSMLEKHSGLRVEFLFNVNVSNKFNPSSNIARRLIEIYNDNGDTVEAFSDWSNDVMELTSWLNKWGKPKNSESEQQVLEHFKWCKDNKINYTPAVIYKNYILPDTYQLKDLSYFLS